MVLAAVDLGPLDDAAAELGVEVTGEGVDRLVVVVVEVVDRVVDVAHGQSSAMVASVKLVGRVVESEHAERVAPHDVVHDAVVEAVEQLLGDRARLWGQVPSACG